MRYVIVCIIRGEAGDFNNIMRQELLEKFKAKSSKLPAHFTIKAPFEYDGSLENLEKKLKSFCEVESKKSFKMNKYDHFDDRVIYMDISMSREGKRMHSRLIDILDKFSYINFTQNDGKDKIFHATLTSKKLPPKFDAVWEYVNQYPFEFLCYFDNISIYKWENNKWNIHKTFELK